MPNNTTLILSFLLTLSSIFNLHAQENIFTNIFQSTVKEINNLSLLEKEGQSAFDLTKDDDHFSYDYLYYIPKRKNETQKLNTVVFLHGGGESTLTRENSLEVVKMYQKNLIKIAKELKVALFIPSASGLNWNNNTIHFLKEFHQYIINQYPVDSKKITLAGHSMGGMAITRYGHWLSGLYNFMLPMAAGMDDRSSNTKLYEKTYFNTPVTYYQGKYDQFEVFVERVKRQNERMTKLEKELDKDSNYTLELYEGGHNYNTNDVLRILKENMSKFTLNPYQKNLYGIFYDINETKKDPLTGKILYHDVARTNYFWLQALELKKSKTVYALEANIDQKNNSIYLKSTDDGIKKIRLYLSKEMVDFYDLKIFYNDQLISHLTYVQSPKKITSAHHALFYSTYLDINL